MPVSRNMSRTCTALNPFALYFIICGFESRTSRAAQPALAASSPRFSEHRVVSFGGHPLALQCRGADVSVAEPVAAVTLACRAMTAAVSLAMQPVCSFAMQESVVYRAADATVRCRVDGGAAAICGRQNDAALTSGIAVLVAPDCAAHCPILLRVSLGVPFDPAYRLIVSIENVRLPIRAPGRIMQHRAPKVSFNLRECDDGETPHDA
jgi:hypothetical protein